MTAVGSAAGASAGPTATHTNREDNTMSGYEQRLGGTHQWRKLRARALRELPLVCAQCSTALDPSAPRASATAPELDHIVPAKYGGAETLENVQWMCSPCNRRKSDRLPDRPAPREYVTWRTW